MIRINKSSVTKSVADKVRFYWLLLICRKDILLRAEPATIHFVYISGVTPLIRKDRLPEIQSA
jgi:hypothetical protein